MVVCGRAKWEFSLEDVSGSFQWKILVRTEKLIRVSLKRQTAVTIFPTSLITQRCAHILPELKAHSFYTLILFKNSTTF